MVNITCESDGLPEPSYSITHNGTEVSTNKTYTIDDVQYRHAGTYKCVAKNKIGNDSASANLTVVGKIGFLKAMSSLFNKCQIDEILPLSVPIYN